MAEKAILIDTSKCIACKGCQVACKQWNELDAGKPEFFSGTDGYENPTDLSYITYNLIKFHLTEKTNGDPDWLFRKYQCMHCTEAACLASCPVDTIKRADNGFVYIDQTGCIGCGTCVSVCPFGIPKLSTAEEEEDGSPKSYKCWGCQDRIAANKTPACVHTCAPGAATYGDWNDKRDDALARRDELIAAGFTDANVYGIDELGGLHYIYVLLKDPSFYGLPTAAELNSSARRAYLKYMKEVGKLFLKKVSSF